MIVTVPHASSWCPRLSQEQPIYAVQRTSQIWAPLDIIKPCVLLCFINPILGNCDDDHLKKSIPRSRDTVANPGLFIAILCGYKDEALGGYWTPQRAQQFIPITVTHSFLPWCWKSMGPCVRAYVALFVVLFCLNQANILITRTGHLSRFKILGSPTGKKD